MKPAPTWRLFRLIGCLALILAGLVLIPVAPVRAAEDQGWLPVTGPCGFAFPGDHLAHDGYRTEWWYYTGNLADQEGRGFGFQLTFFRRGLIPSGPGPKERVSAWRTRQIFLAHFAISDLKNKKHMQAEKMARPVLGLAGVRPEGRGAFIHLNDWSAKIGPDGHHIFAKTLGFALDLELIAYTPVAHGIQGYSQKGGRPDQASCYYSFTRLSAKGGLTINGVRHQAAGSAWMDHEFSSALLDKNISGWDWFGLQLSDQTEIMLFFLRKKDGSLSEASSGTFVPAAGKPVHLTCAQIKILVKDTWTSPDTRATYPSAWTLTIPSLNLDLNLAPNLADQEMVTRETTGVTYWEGSISANGKRNGKKVTGRGYAELTGYFGPGFEADL